MKGILRCQIVEIIDVIKKEDVITIDLLDVIEDAVTIVLMEMIVVTLWEVEEFVLVENIVHIAHLELGKILNVINLVANIISSIKRKYYKTNSTFMIINAGFMWLSHTPAYYLIYFLSSFIVNSFKLTMI